MINDWHFCYHAGVVKLVAAVYLKNSWWSHKWKYFLHNWPFVRGIHGSPVISPHKGQWHGALMFSLNCVLNKPLSKQLWGWWFEMPSRPLWRHRNGCIQFVLCCVLLCFVVFCWDKIAINFTHILQGSCTGTGAVWSTPYEWDFLLWLHHIWRCQQRFHLHWGCSLFTHVAFFFTKNISSSHYKGTLLHCTA